MKLAEALALRSDVQKRLSQVQARAVASARYQEGEQPAENAVDLLTQARELAGELESLIRRINRTNAASDLEPGMTITDAIARRDTLALRRRVVTAVADAASGGHDRAQSWARQLRSELRQVTDVPVSQLRAEADDLARQYRELDTRIQEANWATELAG
jgi:hypothetical protein